MVKVVNVRSLDPDAYNVYIGRKSSLSTEVFKEMPSLIDGTYFGNNVRVSDDCSRDESIAAHREYFLNNIAKYSSRLDTLAEIASVRTVCLVCWCVPKACHGNVIAEYLNELITGPIPDIVSGNLFEEEE